MFRTSRGRQTLRRLLGAFGAHQGGQIVIVFALASAAIFAGLGAGVDLATAFAARQRLSQVATLTCQYSTRPSIGNTAVSTYSGTNGFQTYVDEVNRFAVASLAAQSWKGQTPTGASGAAGRYFTATPAAGSTPTSPTYAAPTNPVVEMSANVPTAFGKILNVASIPVHARIACQTLAQTPQIVNPPQLLKEGFETPCSSYCFVNPQGGTVLLGSPTNSFASSASYVGYNGYNWYITGYCLEIDNVGVINPTVPEGTHAAELDCDNGSGSRGNSSISTKLYFAPGYYEIRYNYRSRVKYVDYDPVYICGSTAADVSWANKVSSWTPGPRTNQINVYLDANLSGTNGTTGSAPLHQTIDGTQYLAGSNLIDTCVYSLTWIERSIRVNVSTPGYYWLSFAADGVSDSYGGQIDNIRVCQGTCAGPLQDNFPTSWLPANNGGVNKVLFEDSFESPTYTQDYPYHYIAKFGDPNRSVGVTVNSAGYCDWYTYAVNPGWPCLQPIGWAVAPFSQITYALNGAYQGSQYIALDGFNANGDTRRNRVMSRPFLLDPGYYQVSYDYISMVNFSSPALVQSPCIAAPGSGNLLGSLPSATGVIRYYNPKTTNQDTNVVAAFMAHSLLVSTPVGGGVQGSATSYSNPDGSVSATPTVPPDGFSRTNYDPTQVNPVLDFCAYADAFAWVPRNVSVKITKPGIYWLSFSSQAGTADGDGGAIDDVKLTALGSPYMSNPPTSALVAIPVPAPQPDTAYTPTMFDGFSIVADPFTPPGADQ